MVESDEYQSFLEDGAFTVKIAADDFAADGRR
jgi:hypothetical protein